MVNGGARWRRVLQRFTASESDLAAAEEQQVAARHGGTPCDRLPLRRRVAVCGTLRAVTLQPRGGVPTLQAELFDGSGTVVLVWLGRRRIAGVEVGRRMTAEGMVVADDGRRVIFNPRYELLTPETV
ncbi:OB-fold nucleic acid binding domain-containing protein [Kineococcus sp. NUM-3379]